MKIAFFANEEIKNLLEITGLLFPTVTKKDRTYSLLIMSHTETTKPYRISRWRKSLFFWHRTVPWFCQLALIEPLKKKIIKTIINVKKLYIFRNLHMVKSLNFSSGYNYINFHPDWTTWRAIYLLLSLKNERPGQSERYLGNLSWVIRILELSCRAEWEPTNHLFFARSTCAEFLKNGSQSVLRYLWVYTNLSIHFVII